MNTPSHQSDVYEMSTGSSVIAEAMEFVNKKEEQIEISRKHSERIQSQSQQQSTEDGSTTTNTTNGVF
jgi:hypothetical protein